MVNTGVDCFPENIRFKYPWRTYQQRVLDDLSSHLHDEHLHVIAPPGSGKTVLGLEVMLRLNRPTLILAPTLAIRNQWIQRFCELFLQQDAEPHWISRDIYDPRQLTVITYQGLHAACNNTKEELIHVEFAHETDVKERKKSNFLNLDAIVRKLKEQQIQTLILDEAHHLKNEWWQTLTRLKSKLSPKVVGLTATPPYDVTPLEWSRYTGLNGAVDAEISVPELIREKDLCPHQDFVYFSKITATEHQKISDFREKASKIFEQLCTDALLIKAIEEHPMMVDPFGQEYYIHENLTFYSACLIYLSANDRVISPSHLELLGIPLEKGAIDLPPLDEKWIGELLYAYLFEEKGYFAANFGEERTALLTKLRRAGIVDRKTIRFDGHQYMAKHLSSSISKLHAIERIVDFEYAQLGQDLRQVILTDYVRKEYLSSTTDNEIPLKRIGVVSIFEQLRRHNRNAKRLGVLTGTLVIIPAGALTDFYTLADRAGLAHRPTIARLPYDETYFSVHVDDRSRDKIVHILTELFQSGAIEVLIGTKALLGEGWDAPAINSLILASFVGSFVASNQMRGRAIRTSLKKPQKTSNIWHIVCLDPLSNDGGADLRLMRRRFRNFVGISENEGIRIENGLGRLGIPFQQLSVETISTVNDHMFTVAAQRNRLHEKWEKALPYGTTLVEEIKIPFFEPNQFERVKTAQMQKTIGNMVSALGSSVLFYVEWSGQVMHKFSKFLGVNGSYALLGMFGIGTVVFGSRALKTFAYYTRYRDISKDIYHIGRALVQTLCKCRIFATPIEKFNVLTYSDKEGAVYCHLDGGTTYEKSLFVQMIQEIVDPIANPRYIIIRKSKALQLIRQWDFHAVPEILGKHAALAKDFATFWQEHVGDCELVFTKSIKGRKIMIRARVHALANHFKGNAEVEHVHAWQ